MNAKLDEIHNKIVEFNKLVEIRIQKQKDETNRASLFLPSNFRRDMDESFQNITNLNVRADEVVDRVKQLKNELDGSLELLNTAKEEISNLTKLANRSTIGTLQGLSRDIIQSYHTVPTEEDANVLHQPYDELEDIRKPTGGKRKTRRRRRTNKRSIRY
jgi:uncharacterized coiled-coil DUF342 family protein